MTCRSDRATSERGNAASDDGRSRISGEARGNRARFGTAPNLSICSRIVDSRIPDQTYTSPLLLFETGGVADITVVAAAPVANPPERDAFVHDTLLIFLEASCPIAWR